MSDAALCLSIVSHGHARLVADLLGDLARVASRFRVVLTLNVPETLAFDPAALAFPLQITRNARPRGFGANHNAAFAACGGAEYFAVLNPDLRLAEDPFPPLLARFADPEVAAVAPLVVAPDGSVEDSARPFPTPWSILRKAAGERMARRSPPAAPFRPDWIAGMFMLFRREAFGQAGGFDERYFLYYEDVDLCARLAKSGLHVEVQPSAKVVHDARRTSHHDLRHMLWHLSSMTRFFCKRAAGRA
jgi:GT2 family glycosyltransferase